MDFNFPDVGEGITEGKLVGWLVKKGEQVKKDQAIAKVETDKAIVEIPIPWSGQIAELFYSEGDVLTVGKPMLSIDTNDSKEESKPAQVKDTQIENKKKEESPQNIVNANEIKSYDKVLAMPKIKAYAKENNIELDKIKGSGLNGRILLADLESSPKNTTNNSATNNVNVNKEILATPATRKLAREKGIDITKINGTGRNSQITADDVLNYNPKQQTNTNISQNIVKTSAHEFGEKIPQSFTRKTIAKKMTESLQSSAQSTTFDEVDAEKLISLRQREKSKHETKITYLPFIIKAVTIALQKHKLLNSELQNDTLEIKKDINIGIAVDTKKGLMVPVIKNTTQKSIIDIATELNESAQKVKDEKATNDMFSGGTFTITSIGNIAGTFFTPIINYPQAAILGIGKIITRVKVINERAVNIRYFPLSLTYDHRIVDGADVSRFLQTLIELIQNPDEMIMEMK